MKKILLSLAGLVLIIASIHILTAYYGGILGVIGKVRSVVFTQAALLYRDPGKCALIGNYSGHGRREYWREKCIIKYTRTITNKSDCAAETLVNEEEVLMKLSPADTMRQECLINHYKYMLGNSLVQGWLSEKCLALQEKLILLENYITHMRDLNKITGSPTHHRISPIISVDVDDIEACESTLNTQDIYSFLRGEKTLEEEKAYIEMQKKKMSQY